LLVGRELDVIGKFEQFGRVTLGLNLKEAQQVFTALGFASVSESESGLREMAEKIRNHPIAGSYVRDWEDEGVIVGRSLDMFISKLRKKLELDERVKIVVIRGIGYRLDYPCTVRPRN
jgi:hypothetical protein